MERDAIDLGSLHVPRLFRKFFIPTLVGMLSVSAVTAVDGIFVGHGVGSDGIAAINLIVPLWMVFTGLGLMVGVGCSVVASLHLARGKVKAARINVTQAMWFVTVVTVAASVVLELFPEKSARLLGASEHLSPLVQEYLVWIVPSLVFQMWGAIALFIIRLDGSPRLAMWCTVLAAGINVVLDWWFIFPLGWGVKGAALATSISILAEGVIVLAYLGRYARSLRLYPLKASRKSLRLSLRNIGYQCRIGSSALLGEITLAVLTFVGNQIFMRYLGDAGVGAFGIACYYTPFVFMVGNAIAQSAQPIISYNIGAGWRERVAQAERIALSTALGCSAVVTAVFVFFPQELVELFVGSDSPATAIAVRGLPYFSMGFIFFVLNLTAIGYYQSVERVVPATAFALLRGVVLLIPAFSIAPAVLGTPGIWLAMPFSEGLTTLAIVLFYLRGRMRR